MKQRPKKQDAIHPFLSDYMAGCWHSYCDAVDGPTGLILQVYICNHPKRTGATFRPCMAMGGNIACRYHTPFGTQGA